MSDVGQLGVSYPNGYDCPLHGYSSGPCPRCEDGARAWWEALRRATGKGLPWDEASDEAKEATRDYIRST